MNKTRWYHYVIAIALLIFGFNWAFERCANIESEPITREERIQSQFSPLDGENYNLKRYIKQIMHNPKSYEHVLTEWNEQDSLLRVKTVIRGENQLGAVVMQRAEALLDENGNVLAFEWVD